MALAVHIPPPPSPRQVHGACHVVGQVGSLSSCRLSHNPYLDRVPQLEGKIIRRYRLRVPDGGERSEDGLNGLK